MCNLDNHSKGVNSMSKSKKAIIISVVSVVLVGIAISVFFIIKNNTLSEHGQTALSYARKLKNNLKSPDSLNFYDDIIYIEANVEGELHEYYYFDYTAKNSFGVEIRSQLVYIDGELRDLNEEKPVYNEPEDYKDPDKWAEAVEENIEMRERHSKVIKAQGVLWDYKLSGSKAENIVHCEVISSKTIASKL